MLKLSIFLVFTLSPYTLEEVVARDYLVEERPNVILNIVDGSNLERNLYLTTQLVELGIPVVLAINMMDVVKKNGDKTKRWGIIWKNIDLEAVVIWGKAKDVTTTCTYTIPLTLKESKYSSSTISFFMLII